MTPALATLIARWVFRVVLTPPEEDLVQIIDPAGHPLLIPPGTVGQVIAAAESSAPHGTDRASENPIWHFNIAALRLVCDIARAAETVDDALFTIYANTTWTDDEDPETD